MQVHAGNFQSTDYDSYDTYGKRTFKSFLDRINHTILSDHEDYDHDIISSRAGRTYYFEIETKVGYPFYDRSSYPFKTVSFLGRKRRLHEIHPFTYIIISYETGWALACESDVIYSIGDEVNLTISKRDRIGGDQFYRISRDHCIFFKCV